MLGWRLGLSAIIIPAVVLLFYLDAGFGEPAPVLLALCIALGLRVGVRTGPPAQTAISRSQRADLQYLCHRADSGGVVPPSSPRAERHSTGARISRLGVRRRYRWD